MPLALALSLTRTEREASGGVAMGRMQGCPRLHHPLGQPSRDEDAKHWCHGVALPQLRDAVTDQRAAQLVSRAGTGDSILEMGTTGHPQGLPYSMSHLGAGTQHTAATRRPRMSDRRMEPPSLLARREGGPVHRCSRCHLRGHFFRQHPPGPPQPGFPGARGRREASWSAAAMLPSRPAGTAPAAAPRAAPAARLPPAAAAARCSTVAGGPGYISRHVVAAPPPRPGTCPWKITANPPGPSPSRAAPVPGAVPGSGGGGPALRAAPPRSAGTAPPRRESNRCGTAPHPVIPLFRSRHHPDECPLPVPPPMSPTPPLRRPSPPSSPSHPCSAAHPLLLPSHPHRCYGCWTGRAPGAGRGARPLPCPCRRPAPPAAPGGPAGAPLGRAQPGVGISAGVPAGPEPPPPVLPS